MKCFRLFFVLLAVCVLWPIGVRGATGSDSISYVPEVHGVFRGRYDLQPDNGAGRFQVRNARVSLTGRVLPVLGYFFQADLCDRGKFTVLDAYGRVTPGDGWTVKCGQFRMPFGVESFRAPGLYWFTNRSVIGRWVNNYRAVGISGGYSCRRLPLTVEGGVFNPSVITDHNVWVKTYAYACKVMFKPGGWLFATGFESLRPGNVRMNMTGVTAGWGSGSFYAEGEYMARFYNAGAHRTTQAYNVFATYGVPLHRGIFDTWSFQGRFDGMGGLASGLVDAGEAGRLATTAPGRRRVTVGTTLDYRYRAVRAAVRMNYEKTWYNGGADVEKGDFSMPGDLMSVELVLKF